MLRNYFKTAWRNLWKNKFYSLLNITGLAAGLAVGILVLLWVQDELSYDRFHSNSKNIYRVLANVGAGTSRQVWTGLPAPVATLAKNEVPEVRDAVRISDMDESLMLEYKDKQFAEQHAAFVDPSFFSVFDFKLLSGNPGEPFHTTNSVILTASAARRYFGEEDPIGKTLMEENYQEHFVVDGVMEDIPANSSIYFDLLFPMSYYAKNFGGNGQWKTIEEDWGNYHFDTYLLLNPGSGTEPVEEKLAAIHNRHKAEAATDPFTLQALTKTHLYNTDGSEGLMQTVRTFIIVAVFILLIASINYVNLSTARSMLRMKEVGVRKITGATRFQLFCQLIAETTLLFLFATAAAFLLIRLLLPAYYSVSGKEIDPGLLSGRFWSVTGLVVLSTLALSSIYPALMLSSSEPLKTLKGRLPGGINAAAFRRVLVTLQFTVSVVLIAGTLVISRQLQYIQKVELGYDKSYVFTVPLTNEAVSHLDALKDGLRKQPGILNVSATSINDIANLEASTGDIDWPGKPENSDLIISQAVIDKDFLPAMKIQLVEGSNLSG
ncbi:MAG TPA: ABC transporter permease, partial [Anseongella sp.]|nr:ABC transporter permease [Anseongella sp.]